MHECHEIETQLENRSFVFHAANWGSASKGIPLEKEALDTRHL